MKARALICMFFQLTLVPAGAQYIAELMEYRPAPGQLINVEPWGTPSGTRSIEEGINGTLSLGAFGGYVIFRFEQAVENDPQNPYGIDFTIFGNPVPEWSEPGVVWVMKDENANGVADDRWYELAGSDHWFISTARNYRVTYFNPGGSTAADIPWEDRFGDTGVIRANSLHGQTYYPIQDSFPSIDPMSYTLEGTKLQGQVYEHSTGISSLRRAFGYADNQLRGREPFTLPDNPYTREVENSGGDAFDIDWAVDSTGAYVDLDRIHFVKVQSSLLADGGRLGEVSTELTGAVDVPPDPSVLGESSMVVIRDLPPILELQEYPLEAVIFEQGRIRPEGLLTWTTSHPGAFVDENYLLHVSQEGPLTVTASLSGRPEVHASASTNVRFNGTHAAYGPSAAPGPRPYPNPTSGHFSIGDYPGATLFLFNASGKELMRKDDYQPGSSLDISMLPEGVYPLRISHGDASWWYKVIRQ